MENLGLGLFVLTMVAYNLMRTLEQIRLQTA